MTKAKGGHLRRVLGRNVEERINKRYRDVSKTTNKVIACAKESGVSRSTIMRIIDPDTYGDFRTSLDVIEALALALRCEGYELLIDTSVTKKGPKAL